MGNSSKL